MFRRVVYVCRSYIFSAEEFFCVCNQKIDHSANSYEHLFSVLNGPIL